MQRATVIHQAEVACPICRLSDYEVRRRTPGSRDGFVEKYCLCQRCSAVFTYTEDRLGRPMRK